MVAERPGGRFAMGTQGVLGGMSEVGTRLRWRDALVLAVLAAVIIGGLVHYGRALGGRDEPVAGGHGSSSADASPTSGATAQLDSAPSADPGARPATRRTCWDGRETSALRLCGLPEGARGLAWVFPSFARDRLQCHKARPNADSYPVVESYECFQRALGQPVTVTYDQVQDPAQVERWLLARLGAQHRREIPGAHGGRCIFKDGATRPARITGMYERFPYVVSVYADSPQAASRAWKVIVRQRPTESIRGVSSA
jgi:hypothetical protein